MSADPGLDGDLYTLYGFFTPVHDDRWEQVQTARPTLQVVNGGPVAAAVEPAAAPTDLADPEALTPRLRAHQAVIESFRRSAIPIVPVTLSTPPLSLTRIKRVLVTQERRLNEAIASLEGMIELDLQATWQHLPDVLKRIAAGDPDIRAILDGGRGPVSAETQVRVGALLARALEQRRVAITQQWTRSLKPVAAALCLDLPAAPNMAVNLAVLLRSDREQNVIAMVSELSRSGDDELQARIVGPLVPVSFSAARVVSLAQPQIEEDCRILGIGPALVTEATVNTAYRRLAHQLHPDQAEEPDNAAFQRIVQAAGRLRALAAQSGGAFRRDGEGEILELPRLRIGAEEEVRP